MRKYPYPNPRTAFKRCKDWEVENGVISCRVKVPKSLYIGPLPYRADTGRLLFPVGEFDGCWTIAELHNAVNYGVKVQRVF